MEEFINSNNEGFLDSSKLPPGYMFKPTDEELVVDYLGNQVFNNPLPLNMIRRVDIYSYNPKQLSEMYERGREKVQYFFTPRNKKYPRGKRPNRAACDGYWKATAADTKVYSKNRIVGHKRSLVFYEGNARSGNKTDWLMHEYTLEQQNTTTTTRAPDDMKLDDWVLCKIYKKRSPKEKEEDGEEMEVLIHESQANIDEQPHCSQTTMIHEDRLSTSDQQLYCISQGQANVDDQQSYCNQTIVIRQDRFPNSNQQPYCVSQGQANVDDQQSQFSQTTTIHLDQFPILDQQLYCSSQGQANIDDQRPHCNQDIGIHQDQLPNSDQQLPPLPCDNDESLSPLLYSNLPPFW